MQLEECIVRFCAPTLAGLKTGSLFNGCSLDRDTLCRDTVRVRKILLARGMDLRLFFKENGPPLLYVYRIKALEHDLNDKAVQAFLKGYGYTNFSPRAALNTLAQHLRQYATFPHEIGLFLSYPLEDVKGFVRLGGMCCKMRGYWCVFHDEERAKACFTAFEHCHQEYLARYCAGQSLDTLALAI